MTDQPIRPPARSVNARPGPAGDPQRPRRPISAADAAAEPPTDRVFPPSEEVDLPAGLPDGTKAPAPKPQITLSTVVEHRGRQITIQATDVTADQFCDLLDKRGFQAPEQARQWQTLPDGTPICPKHHAPMRLREKQGDSWYSHSVGEDASGKHIYCKGYHGKDSPGYDQ